LNIKEQFEVNEYLLEKGLMLANVSSGQFANRTLFQLWKIIHDTKTINFFLETDKSLDKVLNIFIRVNSGGTQLSYSDLLLSIATAQWKTLDAREEITNFVDEVNNIGDRFNVNKDFILKSCLILSDFKDIAFKVDNFNTDNMQYIEERWGKFKSAIRKTLILVSSFGYNRDTLTSYNALIPIAYYIYRLDPPDNFVEAQKYTGERKIIFKWLVISLLKKIYGGQPDGVLRPMREAIQNSVNESFPFSDMVGKVKGTTKSMSFDEDEMANLLHYQYAQSYTYSVLALLYPNLDYRNKFHQDHIFPIQHRSHRFL